MTPEQQANVESWLSAHPTVTNDTQALAQMKADHQIPQPVNTVTLFNLLSADSKKNLANWSQLTEMRREITADPSTISGWIQILVGGQLITQDDVNSVESHLSQQITDRDWDSLQVTDVTAARAALAIQTTNQTARQALQTGFQAAMSYIDQADRDGVAVVWADVVSRVQAAGG